jgi:CubicO group peptidase (beta-lactamase class C family)
MKYLLSFVFIFSVIFSSAQSFGKVDTAIDSLIAVGKVSGGVAVIWHDGKVVHEKSYGWKDAAHEVAMPLDGIFRIASQTKLIVSVAALQLIEKNKFNLDTPIETWLPVFSNQKVAEKSGQNIVLVERKKSITLRHLLSHTSGISSSDEWPQFGSLFKEYGLEKPLNYTFKSLEEEVNQIAQMPLVHQPGARFSYGVSTDVLARWIEVVSGVSLGEYLSASIFKPLNMVDTYFKLPADRKERLLPVNITGPSGKLMELGNQFFPVDFPIRPEITIESAAGGLVSTPQDYMKLLVCLMNDGFYAKRKSLFSKQWLDSLSTSQMAGEKYITGGIKSKNTFGLGVGVTTKEGSEITHASEGSFFWGGAFNTAYLVDRKKRVITLFMFQRAPFDMPRILSSLERLAFDSFQ